MIIRNKSSTPNTAQHTMPRSLVAPEGAALRISDAGAISSEPDSWPLTRLARSSLGILAASADRSRSFRSRHLEGTYAPTGPCSLQALPMLAVQCMQLG
jgi:hypothetical protein